MSNLKEEYRGKGSKSKSGYSSVIWTRDPFANRPKEIEISSENPFAACRLEEKILEDEVHECGICLDHFNLQSKKLISSFKTEVDLCIIEDSEMIILFEESKSQIDAHKNKKSYFRDHKHKIIRNRYLYLTNQQFEMEEEQSLVKLGGHGICVLSPCKHMYHRYCIREWFRNGHNSCPMCRTTIFKYPDVSVYSEYEDYDFVSSDGFGGENNDSEFDVISDSMMEEEEQENLANSEANSV